MKIGFFDSGLGGLTVLKEAIKNEKLKGEIYYLGDNKNTPYGIKNEDFVKMVVEDNIKTLVEYGCNPIVIACNTATSLCIKSLREKYKDIIFIGTEPAVKVAADAYTHKKILVLATSITVKQEKLLNLIDKLGISDCVELVAADKLVQFAEDVNCSNLKNEIYDYIEKLLLKYDLKKFSHIVLGCTHFPLFYDEFKYTINKLYPNCDNINIVDGAKGISNNLIKNIKNVDKTYDNLKDLRVHIIMTKQSEEFKIRTKQILDLPKIDIEYKLQ